MNPNHDKTTDKDFSVHIGTSGWVYKHWHRIFYPADIPEKEYLKYYSQKFFTVEVNNSFYHLLKEEAVKNWVKSVPEDFIFAVKASRYITHMKKLKEPNEAIIKFLESIKPFENKIGPILFQLPPKFSFSPQRLEYFIHALPKNYRYAFEFRDKSWFNQETYDILKNNNIGLCIYDLGGYQSPKEITSDFVYIRLHGNYGLGSGKYTEKELGKIAQYIEKFKSKNKDIYCYFNNDERGYAIDNASELIAKLKK